MESYKHIFYSFFFIVVGLNAQHKIVGLMQVRNEQDIVEQALRGLACYADAIVVLDDASTDQTCAIVERLSKELIIEQIIKNTVSEWQEGSEFTNRQKLLDMGRKIGGTHFIELDADEIFAATASKGDALKKKILALEPGQILHVPLINFWKGFDSYRSKFTNCFPDITYCSAIFCDDGSSTLAGNKKHSFCGFLHFGRFPAVRRCESSKQNLYEPSLDYCIMHLPYVNWNNVRIKQVWIMMLERIRLKDGLYNKKLFTIRTPKDVNDFYQTYQSLNDDDAEFDTPKQAWFDYGFFDQTVFLTRSVKPKLDDIRCWSKQYGVEYFSDLSMIYDDLQAILEGRLQ